LSGGVRGAILAGGGATRFGGRPKGLEEVGGERILDRLVRVMTAAFGGPPLLVANAPDAPAWRPDLRVVADVRPGLGSLGGIYTAVVETPAAPPSRTPWIRAISGPLPSMSASASVSSPCPRSLDMGTPRSCSST
jgi:molybdopterin-guanine dinucleotide biosynthesis protein A